MYWYAGSFWKFIIFLIIMNCTVFRTCFCLSLKSKETEYNPNDDVEYFTPDYEKEEETGLNYKPKLQVLRIETAIRFRYAQTKVIPHFFNEDRKKSHAVNFTLTIPSEAFITNLEVKVDGRIYEANITSNEKLKEIIEFSLFEGRSVTAVAIEQGKKANSYRLQFLIGAMKKVSIRITYEELLVRNDNQYEYAFNLKPEKSDSMVEVEAYSISVNIEETEPIKIHFPEIVGELSSAAYKKPAVKQVSPTKAKIAWSMKTNDHDDDSPYSPFDDQFIFQYSLENETNRGEMLIRNGHFVHFFAPAEMEDLIKHVVFVLDVSDSMTGAKVEQLKSAMRTIIDDLKLEDFFNIITFSTDSEVWSNFNGHRSKHVYPFPANGIFRDNGLHFINNKLIPKGSTNILGALEKAIELIHNVSYSDSHKHSMDFVRDREPYFNNPKNYLYLNKTLPENVESVIIFLTDGEPTSGNINRLDILDTVKLINKDPFVPIYTLAFGESADYEFLKELSYQNGAFSRKITETADADIQVAQFYNEISSPVMSNVSFKYTSANPGFYVDVDIPNSNHFIFKGQEIVFAGKLRSNSSSETKQNISAEIRGRTRKGSDVFTSKINAVCVPSSGKGRCSTKDELADDLFLERLMAYLTIKKLVLKDLPALPKAEYAKLNVSSCEKILETHFNEEEYIMIAEDMLRNRFAKTCEYLKAKEKIISIAMKYKFVTPFTSLLMRTKSIGEVERDLRTASDEDNVELDWFLGSEIPLPPTSKATAEFLTVSTLTPPSVNTTQNITTLLQRAFSSLMEIHFLNLYGRSSSSRNVSSTSNTTKGAHKKENNLNVMHMRNVNESESVANKSSNTRNEATINSTIFNLSNLKNVNNASLETNETINVTTFLNEEIHTNYTLEDVTWWKQMVNIPVLQQNILIPTYYNVLADSQNTTDQQFQQCHSNSSTEVSGVCKHLKDCILSSFIRDFELFKSSYVCPIVIDGERYLGTCCPV